MELEGKLSPYQMRLYEGICLAFRDRISTTKLHPRHTTSKTKCMTLLTHG